MKLAAGSVLPLRGTSACPKLTDATLFRWPWLAPAVEAAPRMRAPLPAEAQALWAFQICSLFLKPLSRSQISSSPFTISTMLWTKRI